MAGKHINRLRRSLGLRSVKGIVNKWWYSPDLTLVDVSNWFALGDDLLGERMRPSIFRWWMLRMWSRRK